VDDLRDLLQMTWAEGLLVGLTLLLCVGGLLLPRLGNEIGRAVMGEDPAVRGLRAVWARRQAARKAKGEGRRLRRRFGRGEAATTTSPADAPQ
jgi:hypothetical protein